MFADYRRSAYKGIPDIILLWLWQLHAASSDNVFISLYRSYKNIRDLDKFIDNTLYPKQHISSFNKHVQTLRRNRLHFMLMGRGIDLKEAIHAIPLTLPLVEQIRMVCTEACRMLYRRQCALSIRRHMFRWYRRSFKSQELLVRNRPSGDEIMAVHYHPSESFWPHALSTKFGGLEDGRYVVRCGREGTTPEAVKWVCRYTVDRRATLRLMRERMMEVVRGGDYGELESWIRAVCIIADKWFYPAITEVVSGVFQEYIRDTIGAEWLQCGLRKMELFVGKDPLLARYIWETNCTSEKSRIILAVQAGLGKKLFNGFIKSATIDDLSEYIEKRSSMQKTVYDNLSVDLKKRIRQAEADLLDAHRGVRVGLTGRYISSDAIHAADTRLFELWRRADREVAALRKQKNSSG